VDDRDDEEDAKLLSAAAGCSGSGFREATVAFEALCLVVFARVEIVSGYLVYVIELSPIIFGVRFPRMGSRDPSERLVAIARYAQAGFDTRLDTPPISLRHHPFPA
jgi:hypothetical protein